MIILISILFAAFQACIATNYTYIAAFYTPVGTDETLGTISLKFYGHENLWELLAGINKVERPYSLPSDNLTKDTPVHSKIKIPPATLCTRFMNSTCLQIVEYISEQNERWRNNETVAEIIRNKLDMDPSSQFDWATTRENYAPSLDSNGRILQLETLELGLFVWDMFSMFLENTELGRAAMVKSSFTIQIINKTPDILTNFTVMGEGEQTNSIVEKISLFARPGESGYVFTTCGSQNCPFDDSPLSGGSSGVVSFQADDNRDFRFLVSWNDNVGHDSQTYADLKMKVASLDSDYVSLFISESDICNSPGYWRTKRLNYQYSAKSFVSGLPGERIATIILYEDWQEGADPRVIASDTFYTIWNNQESQALTAAVDSTNSSDPFKVYQYTNLNDSSQEWRFHLVYLQDTEEQGYVIVNEKLLLLLTATSDGTLEIQSYNNDDLRAQIWLITELSDGRYQIQNLKYKTFLSSENQVDNNDLWTLKETVDSSTLSERFILNFIEIDFPETTFEDDYYHMIAPETAPQMGVTATSSPVSVQLQAQDKTNKQQFWLIKNVTQPNTNTITTGFIIMNHGLNLVLAINDNNTLIASPLISTTDAASLSQLWDVQLREGSIYSSSSYQIRNLKYTDYYLTTDSISTGSNLFVTTTPESGFLLTRSDVKGYTPFTNGVPYHISTFKTTTQYVMDTFSTHLIYGWSVTGELKQKWKLYNATRTSDGTPRQNAFYIQSMYNLTTTDLTYLTYTTSSAAPKSAIGSFAQQDQQSWTVLADSNYYGLVYTIRPYLYATAYLTAPASKTNNAGFTLAASSVRPDDQRFRILISDETFFK